jgi:predicted DNA-binding ribbon-helix-helix protein
MQKIAMAKGMARPRLIAQIKQSKPANLSSAIRVFVLAYYQGSWR